MHFLNDETEKVVSYFIIYYEFNYEFFRRILSMAISLGFRILPSRIPFQALVERENESSKMKIQ